MLHRPCTYSFCPSPFSSSLLAGGTTSKIDRDMTKMSMLLMLLLGVVALSSSSVTAAVPCEESGGSMSMIKTQTFVSPPIFLGPGSVSNKVYSDVDFPRGHVAIKSFNGELVDEAGAPVPLHETYLHHWLVSPYYYAVAEDGGEDDVVVAATNSGICKDLLGQYFGLGAETRRTATWVPDPYGIEIGVPPAGYEERWSINVHAIDTRGAADALGCTECRCDLYNVTVDGYAGGFRCCPDGARCKVDGDGDKPPPPRKLFLRYTVTWLDWSDAVVPVRIYIFDVTDTALLDGRPKPECKVEYDVEQWCGGSSDDDERNGCVDVRVTKEMVPRGGDLVYGVGHLHRAGMGASLHGQDGRLLCTSTPIYGTGHEAGDEAGYVVGMSTCYPEPGTVKVRDGEVLTFVSNYSSAQKHTGVMSHFYILLAEGEQDKKQAPSLCFSFPVSWCLPAWAAWSNQL